MQNSDAIFTELFNRLKKNHLKLEKWALRNKVSAYRVYDKDLPNFPFTIDRYGRYFVINSYLKFSDEEFKIDLVTQAVASFFDVADEKIFLKERRRIKDRRQQYSKVDTVEVREIVQESGLRFIVNLSDYTDTGLFLDHRPSRMWVRENAKEKNFLNLFCYTGTVSCNAALGQAKHICSVDLSNTYLLWAQENMKINGLDQDARLNEFIRLDCFVALKNLIAAERKFDLIFVDPPSFSNSKKMEGHFDVQSHHVELLKLCLQVLDIGGVIFFSNNYRDFKMDLGALQEIARVQPFSHKTLPPDFRDKKIHNSWLLHHLSS